MSTRKYSTAPLSEVTMGALFKGNILLHSGIIFDIILQLRPKYALQSTSPVAPEEVLNNGQIAHMTDYSSSGFSMYRLVSIEGSYTFQLQQNYLSLSWIRQDNQDVGGYPGFEAVYAEFESVLATIQTIIAGAGLTNPVESLCKAFILSYQDRVNIFEALSNQESVENILNIKLPNVVTNDGEMIKVGAIQSKFATPIPKLNGFSVITILTEEPIPDEKKLIVDFKLKGYSENLSEWFDQAHTMQQLFFEDLFSKRLLDQWKGQPITQ